MKKLLRGVWLWTKPYLTPRMIPCLIIAWCITNGWAYVFVALGPRIGSTWMTVVGGTWIAILWMPWTPEKPLVTIPLSVIIYRLIYREKFQKHAVVCVQDKEVT